VIRIPADPDDHATHVAEHIAFREGMSKSIYVAGPMRGYDCFNFRSFDAASHVLAEDGWTVINPAQMDRDEFGWGICPEDNQAEGFDVEDALRRDFLAILNADAIALLPGWEHSTGAKAEKFVAETTGKTVYEFYPTDGLREISRSLPESGEVRVVDPDTGGAKGQKLARFDLLPWDVLRIVAEHYGRGAEKYEDRNWEKGYDWSLSFAALMRHLVSFWQGEDIDAETNSPHLAAVVFHALALLAFSQRGLGKDTRP
jgi:hypothetical protein